MHVCAPFFFSCDINEIDEFTLRLMTNADVVNINQDELGHVAEVIWDNKDETIMLKKMSDGSKILAVFNRNPDDDEKVINVKWSEYMETDAFKVYDVWRQKDLGIYNDGMSVKLSPDGVGLFSVCP